MSMIVWPPSLPEVLAHHGQGAELEVVVEDVGHEEEDEEGVDGQAAPCGP